MIRVPVSAPAAVGWNFTAIRQLFPAEIEVQALLFSAKLEDTVTVPIVTVPPLPFVTVIYCTGLVPPTYVVGKFTGFGVTETGL